MKSSSLYLAQSYQDAITDYTRSLNGSVPAWDFVILTASNEHQAHTFELQIRSRGDSLPRGTGFAVIPDEGGVRVGSGGATLSVLKYLASRGGWAGKKILLIHSGGDSRRVPQYSALGKLFSPVPHVLPDGRSSTLFDELLVAMSPVPARIREGMMLLSGDVLLLFNPLLIDWNGSGAAVVSFKEDAETGKNHGVYLRGKDGNVQRFLHKQSVETLRAAGAVNEAGEVDIDTGAILLGRDVLDALFSLIGTDGKPDGTRYRTFVNDTVRLSLYGDFQYPMASDSSLPQFLQEKPEGESSNELTACRTAVWNALRPFRLKLLRMAPARFIHFGTSEEVLRLYTSGVEEYASLSWTGKTNSSGSCASYNSVVEDTVRTEPGVYAEVSHLRGRTTVGTGTILSHIEAEDEEIPAGVVLHGLRQTDGKYVARIYGIHDNPKENKLFGRKLEGDLWDSGVKRDLWNAKIYPECEDLKTAVRSALALHSLVTGLGTIHPDAGSKSLASGFNDADPEAIPAWNQHMEELVRVERIAEMIREGKPVSEVPRIPELTPVQTEWMDRKMKEASFSERLRLKYYIETAAGKEPTGAFQELSASILAAGGSAAERNTEARIRRDVEIDLPLRVNFGGGWSDTPPYCNEHGGTVLNAAVLLNGDRPVKVRIRRIDEPRIVLESADMDVHGEFTCLQDLLPGGDPYDPFILQKAALAACGVISREDTGLEEICGRLGGGFIMSTEVAGVPKGSGLGTSSILAAGAVKAIFEFLGIGYTEEKLYSVVLAVEQIMSTGGGWQDQAGGLTDGIKFITSKPGLKQELRVQHLQPDAGTMAELNRRFCLIYTGQRRLARNLLRDVVGRYIGNEPDALYALNEIQRNAALQRFELERGNVDAFAELLSRHWELSKMLDRGSTNTLIDQIFDSCDDLLAGKMICGAGGGGFLQVVLKSGVSKGQLQERLKTVFSDTDIGVWDCELV